MKAVVLSEETMAELALPEEISEGLVPTEATLVDLAPAEEISAVAIKVAETSEEDMAIEAA